MTYLKQLIKTTVLGVLMFHGYHSTAQCGQLIWSDEFNGTTLDESKWAYDLGNGCPNLCGWGNSELQSYTSNSNNIQLNNGLLEITARNDNGSYTSAKITTEGLHTWQYGRFEMRAKLASGTGLWPAFWMLPVNGSWPMTGEIDIMENRGDEMDHIGGTLHYGSSYPANQHDGTGYDLENGTFADDFHVFAVEWEEGEIRWYVDDELFKTETSNPNTLNPASTDNAWPWDDQEFFIIVNLAIGGENTWYTGTQAADFGTSATMEIDYVRVYNSAVPTVEISGNEHVYQNTTEDYAVTSDPNQTYLWTVPTDAEIISGQGTNTISVDWGNSTGGDITLSIEHTSGDCQGATYEYVKSIDVFENSCSFVFEDAESASPKAQGFISGEYTEAANPSSSSLNSSSSVIAYTRNSDEQYDVIIYEDVLLDPASNYSSGDMIFKIDLYTDAPIGTNIELQIGNLESAGTYPSGIHTVFTGSTSVQNAWETITFTYSSSPDPNGANYEDNLDRMILLFNPNSYTGTTYYFDNLRREISAASNQLEITGSQSIEEGETGVSYTVNGGDINSSYDWNVPNGAIISSGQETDEITVDFGQYGGFVSVKEVIESGCSQAEASLQVAIGNNGCYAFSDEFDNDESNWISIDGEAGFTSTESNNEWNINSTGHDEWASVLYELNNGTSATTLDATESYFAPFIHIRAKASAPVILRATFIDVNGVEAANNYLLPVNTMYLTTDYQDFTLDFEGQFWDEFNGGGLMDTTQLEYIKLSVNPGWQSYPETGYESDFVGDIQIDHIRVGETCNVTNSTDIVLETLDLYPNPTQNIVTINSTSNITPSSIMVIDMQGKDLRNLVSTNGNTIDLSDLENGTYVISIKTQGNSFSKLIVKQ